MLYVQREIYDDVCDMLIGAMDLLIAGDPLKLSTDVGPLIDEAAHTQLKQYIDSKAKDVLNQTPVDVKAGYFLPPTLIKVRGIEQLDEERFGPILHIAPYDAENLPTIVGNINARGYGLTFGCHTRVRERAEYLASELHVGNIYINRNQIGAVVESQPFGGEGLSGTGPKAGGPQYIQALRRSAVRAMTTVEVEATDFISEASLKAAWDELRRNVKPAGSIRQIECPGVTGESNTLIVNPRGYWLCAGDETAWEMAKDAATAGNPVLLVTKTSAPEGFNNTLPIHRIKGDLNPAHLANLSGLYAVSLSGAEEWCRQARRILSQRQGVIVPLLLEPGLSPRHVCEKHLCEDTTAAGGNPQLFMQ
jgi:RHH-type transcriptional regulator, proline utilization regulon repressor / proline dehydrogenase / delta 1-pyrroline-5-carboxylate dehydrogenase